MAITVATESRTPEIIELWKELMGFHNHIDPRFPMRKNAQLEWEKHLRELMRSADALVLVALEKDVVVGYSVAEISKYVPIFEREICGLIDSIVVQSAYRRKGIGEYMLAKTYEWFESRNVDRIELSVSAKNNVGYSFWKKHGFQDYLHRLYLDRD